MKTVFVYFVSMLVTVQVSSQELKAAFDAIGKGDVETLSGFFGNQVEVCINERVDLLTKTAAINSLKQIFTANPPKSITSLHKGASKSKDAAYSIATLTTTNGKTFRVYLFAEQVGNKQVIQEIRFDKG